MLGHLIDSAANNHLRFVGTQVQNGLHLPSYEQDNWVKVQHYEAVEWELLVSLWESYNRHLLNVMTHVPTDKLNNKCVVEDNPPQTLQYLMQDYLVHLKHHLAQLV